MGQDLVSTIERTIIETVVERSTFTGLRQDYLHDLLIAEVAVGKTADTDKTKESEGRLRAASQWGTPWMMASHVNDRMNEFLGKRTPVAPTLVNSKEES